MKLKNQTPEVLSQVTPLDYDKQQSIFEFSFMLDFFKYGLVDAVESIANH